MGLSTLGTVPGTEVGDSGLRDRATVRFAWPGRVAPPRSSGQRRHESVQAQKVLQALLGEPAVADQLLDVLAHGILHTSCGTERAATVTIRAKRDLAVAARNAST